MSGLASANCVSFESVQFPGYYLRHQYCQLKLNPHTDDDGLFASDATFVPRTNPSTPGGYMFRAFSPWWLWLSVTRDNAIYVAPNPRYQDSVFILRP